MADKYFQLYWLLSEDPPFSGRYKWEIPMADCPECGQIVAAEFSYPTVNLEELGVTGLSDFDGSQDETSWDEFVRRRNRVLDVLGEPLSILPGTVFGPFKGRVTAAYEPITRGDFFSLELREDALDTLREKGLLEGIGVSPAELRGKRFDSQVFCVELPPVAEIVLPVGQKFCTLCWQSPDKVKPLSISSSSIPSGAHLFKVKNSRNTQMIVSAKFVETVRALGWKGLPEFSPVNVV